MGDINLFLREIGIALGGVGAGSWEGGEMMARWIYKHKQQIIQQFSQFDQPVSLELGSGIGLTGLVMGMVIPTVLTDYKTSLLENLQYNLWVNTDCEGKGDQFDNEAQYETFKMNATILKENVNISYIDWYAPNCREPPFDRYEIQQLLPSGQKLKLFDLEGKKFKLIYGSELNYCMETVIPLANTIDAFLAPGGAFWEVVSIFRGSGVKAFMEEMQSRGYQICCRALPDEFYIGIESCQRKRDEKYLMWTLFKGDECQVMQFGDGELIKWETLEYRRDL